MDEIRLNEFFIAVKKNEKVAYDFCAGFGDVLDKIYKDIESFPFYTFSGKIQDLIVKLTKNGNYEGAYHVFLMDVEKELEKLIVPNIILLPMNFLIKEKFESDVVLNERLSLFMPSKEDLQELSNSDLLSRQHNKRKKRSNLCNHFYDILGSHLDKEHILLAKDRNFFNYPTLAIRLNNIDYKVEEESGRIVEAIYAIARMMDFDKDREDHGWGMMAQKTQPAHTYVVYYKSPKIGREKNYYGYSFRYNFSPYLDINTEEFIGSIDEFKTIVNLYMNLCFLDKRKIIDNNIKLINRWKNAIAMFNTAYEFASIEKYDSCMLILMALLESVFLENEGIGKQKRLLEEIKLFYEKTKNKKKSEEIFKSVESIYKARNKFMHEGIGFESEFKSSRRLNDNQGLNKGMKPFAYSGSFDSREAKICIRNVFRLVIDLILSESMVEELEKLT